MFLKKNKNLFVEKHFKQKTTNIFYLKKKTTSKIVIYKKKK